MQGATSTQLHTPAAHLLPSPPHPAWLLADHGPPASAMAAVTRRLLASPFALLHNTRSFSSCAPLWTLSTSGEPTAHTAARAASRQQQAAPAAAGAVDAAGRHSRGKRTRSWEAFAAMAGAPLARDIVTAGSVVLREVREGGGGGGGHERRLVKHMLAGGAMQRAPPGVRANSAPPLHPACPCSQQTRSLTACWVHRSFGTWSSR